MLPLIFNKYFVVFGIVYLMSFRYFHCEMFDSNIVIYM